VRLVVATCIAAALVASGCGSHPQIASTTDAAIGSGPTIFAALSPWSKKGDDDAFLLFAASPYDVVRDSLVFCFGMPADCANGGGVRLESRTRHSADGRAVHVSRSYARITSPTPIVLIARTSDGATITQNLFAGPHGLQPGAMPPSAIVPPVLAGPALFPPVLPPAYPSYPNYPSVTPPAANALNPITPVASNPMTLPSSDVYRFPFASGVAASYSQGPGGGFSHGGDNAYDLVADEGTQIAAARAGTVTNAVGTNGNGGDPNIIEVQQDNGTTGIYLHMKQGGVLVRVGDRIAAGQVIGLVGTTGFSTGPHLHYQVDGIGMTEIRFITRENPAGGTLQMDQVYTAP
jgi:hypothetical protein